MSDAASTIPRMASAVDELPIRPLTVDEVLRMVEAGILPDHERLELLGGVLRAKGVKSPAHELVKTRLFTWLAPGMLNGRYLIHVEAPLDLPDRTSQPEPDVSVVEPRDYAACHPVSALLVVEVAVSSLKTDTGIKAALYAEAGVPEYWVVDVKQRRLEVFSEPESGKRAYARRETREPKGTIAPRAIEVDEPLDLAKLFDGI